MTTDTRMLLRRAVALRHTPEARAFWTAALDALCAGTPDPELAGGLLCRAAIEPVLADTVTDWLNRLVHASGEPFDLPAVLARADLVGRALSGVRADRGPVSRRARLSLREAMDSATAA